MPEDGWVWTTHSSNYGNQRSGEYYGTGNTACPTAGPPPSGFTVLSSALGPYCNAFAQIPRQLAYKPEQALTAIGPMEAYTNHTYGRWDGAPTPPSQSTVESSIDDALTDPENATLAAWIDYSVGAPGVSDPTGVGEDNPEIEFPGWVFKFGEHGDEFDPAYTDPHEYWRDAADIVERGNDPEQSEILKCLRSDGALIYYDPVKQAIVVVKEGKIVTYFVPDIDTFEYWLGECNK